MWDSNLDCWINLYVCRISPKMFWIQYLVGISYFTKFLKICRDCMRNAKKSLKIPYSAMVRKMEK